MNIKNRRKCEKKLIDNLITESEPILREGPCTYIIKSIGLCMWGCIFFCLHVCLSVCPSVCLSARMSVSLCVCLSVHLSVCLSVCLSLSLSVCLSVHLRLKTVVKGGSYFSEKNCCGFLRNSWSKSAFPFNSSHCGIKIAYRWQVMRRIHIAVYIPHQTLAFLDRLRIEKLS